jgi:hypothetical protein
MTEAEWLECTDPWPMMAFIRDKISKRKLCLFALACCERIPRVVSDPVASRILNVVALFADGIEGEWQRGLQEECARAHWLEAHDQFRAESDNSEETFAAWDAVLATISMRADFFERAARSAAIAIVPEEDDEEETGEDSPLRQAEHAEQCRLMRDLIGCSLFRSVEFDKSTLQWNNGLVAKLAQGIYDDRAFERMPILADALEDAGCHDADILAHCRSEGPHVRGCWVIDLLLAKDR